MIKLWRMFKYRILKQKNASEFEQAASKAQPKDEYIFPWIYNK